MAEVMKVVTHPDPELRKKSRKVAKSKIKTKEFRSLCKDMIETMHVKDGVGLAAPQVGVKQRIFIVNTKEGPIVIINPEFKKKSWAKEWGDEGCLSVPYTYGEVKRHKEVTCCFVDVEGKEHEIKTSGLLARVFQHEFDHLDGVLFIDKAKNVKRLKKSSQDH